MGTFFGAVSLAAGVYCIYGYLMMVQRREIVKNIMLPKGVDPRKCKDVEAYIRMTAVPLVVLGIVLIVYGAAELINMYVVPLGMALGVLIALVLVACIWFGFQTKKANDRYFPQ